MKPLSRYELGSVGGYFRGLPSFLRTQLLFPAAGRAWAASKTIRTGDVFQTKDEAESAGVPKAREWTEKQS
jgi:hypothetical protein